MKRNELSQNWPYSGYRFPSLWSRRLKRPIGTVKIHLRLQLSLKRQFNRNEQQKQSRPSMFGPLEDPFPDVSHCTQPT
jgi:hypothetical protein